MEKLRGLRLVKTAELVEAAVEQTLTYNALPDVTGAESEPIIHSNAFCERSRAAEAHDVLESLLLRHPIYSDAAFKNSGHGVGNAGSVDRRPATQADLRTVVSSLTTAR